MTFGRLKHLISSLAVYLILTSFNVATYAQASGEVESNRLTNVSAGDRASLSSHALKSDAIDSINNRISAEGFERVWQMTGPFGGDVTALAIDPRNPDRVLLGTSDGQVFRSTDGGMVWKRIRPGVKATGFAVTIILFDREKPDVIFVGVKAVTQLGEETKGGSIFVSEDAGESWREFEGMHGKAVRGLVQSVKDPNVFVAAALDGVYRTLDRGQSWKRITPFSDPELRGFHSVAIDPRDVNIIYVGTNHLPWKTLDGGETWKRAGSKETGMIDDSDIFAIHVDEANPDTVVMSACSGIYRSLDASSKWTKIQGIPYTSRRTHVIYQHPTRPEVIFAGTTEGLWLSNSGGKPDSWRRVTSLRLVINAIAIHPDRPDRVFLGTEDNGILVSNDGGESYDPSNAGFINRQVRTVLADQKEPGRVYAGVIFDGANSGLFVSEDGGLSWQQSMDGMGVRDVYSIYQPASNPETIYAGTNHGLFRSEDQGRNWAPVKKEEIKEEIEGDPTQNPNGKLNGNPNGKIEGADQPETQPSPNGGRPRRVKSAEGSRSVQPIVKTRAKAQQKKKSGAKVRKQAKAKTKKPPVVKKPAAPPSDLVELKSQVFSLVQFTPRREAELNNSSDGASNQSSDQTQSNATSNWLIASTWDGLFRTEDERKGWKPIYLRRAEDGDAARPRQPHIHSIATSPLAPGLILVGTEEGLFVSENNGETFKLTLLDDEVRRVRHVVIDPRTAETIYVGTSTGFFRSTDGGRSWENRGGGMPLIANVGALAINLLNPDELFVSDDLRANFYHSKDKGKSWEMLDISQLPSTKIWSLASDPFDQNKLYAGSFSGGVYVMSRR